nr:MAG TPA: YnzC [Caudoviricetes sp.]
MVSNREDFLMNLLNCGSFDLRLIDDVGYDWCDILDSETLGEMLSDLSRRRDTLNYIMRRVIEFGIDQIATAVADRICELRAISNERELDADEAKELDALRTLNPEEDIGSYHNYIDTHVWFENNANTYHTYLQEALDDFAEGTGFEIGGD